VLFVSMMFLAALVTATLNLDTSVVFLTPVLLQTARFRSVKEEAFLYGSIFMANAASLLLLGSNLTNILVFSRSDVRGVAFARTMFVPWLLSITLTTLVVLVWRCETSHRSRSSSAMTRSVSLPGRASLHHRGGRLDARDQSSGDSGVGCRDPRRRYRHRRSPPLCVRVLGEEREPAYGRGLFVLATCVSVASRYWHSPSIDRNRRILADRGVAAASSNLINNLPAAAMLSAKFRRIPTACSSD